MICVMVSPKANILAESILFNSKSHKIIGSLLHSERIQFIYLNYLFESNLFAGNFLSISAKLNLTSENQI